MYWFSFREEGSFEIGLATSRGWKKFGRRWTRGVGGLENWTIFMDVTCVSSLSYFSCGKFEKTLAACNL